MKQQTIERCKKVKFLLDTYPDKTIKAACAEVGIERGPYYMWAKKFKLSPGKIKKGKKLIKKMMDKVKTSNHTIDPKKVNESTICICPDIENLKDEIEKLKNDIVNRDGIIKTEQDNNKQLLDGLNKSLEDFAILEKSYEEIKLQKTYWENRSLKQSTLLSEYLLEGFINGTLILKHEKVAN